MMEVRELDNESLVSAIRELNARLEVCERILTFNYDMAAGPELDAIGGLMQCPRRPADETDGAYRARLALRAGRRMF
jgi:hypothetical protein